MIFEDFRHRSSEKEILDDFELKGNDLSGNLKDLEKVNTYLGGYNIILEGIRAIIRTKSLSEPIRVADIGCGGGDALRILARWSRSHKKDIRLTGIDGNPSVVELAREFSQDFPEIEYQVTDVFSPGFARLDCDIVMFNLFLHHFEDQQIVDILKTCRDKKVAILINDLQRSPVAYHLFRIVSRIFRFSCISRHDGKLSVKKSFRKKDWKRLLSQAGIRHYDLEWKWAFRYRVLVTEYY